MQPMDQKGETRGALLLQLLHALRRPLCRCGGQQESQVDVFSWETRDDQTIAGALRRRGFFRLPRCRFHQPGLLGLGEEVFFV